jgi:addiction module RelB/DinJ family antitoxin
MSNALLSIRTDDETKKEVADFAASVGLSVSGFVTVILKQAVREGRVVLTPTLEPTHYLETIMRKAEADLKAGRNVSPPMNRDQAREHLRSLMK